MNLFAVIGAGIMAAAFSVLLKQYKPEFAMLLSLVASVLLFGVVLAQLIPAFSFFRRLMGEISVSSEYIGILIKALGICYLCEIAVQICKESGQSAIASRIELAGKAAVLLLSLPLFEALFETIFALIHL